MFSTLRTRFGAPGIIAVIALVFAMGGSAFAAKYLITSTKQIKPSVLTALKGKAGPAGPTGLAGSAGSKGDAGAPGAAGKEGSVGKSGENGKSVEVTPINVGIAKCSERGGAEVIKEAAPPGIPVCNGAQGATGKPWTPDNTLPVGATLTGVWVVNGSEADTEGVYAPIGFPVKLAKLLSRSHAHFSTDPDFDSMCKEDVGSVNSPGAKPGELCVYMSESTNATFDGMPRVAQIGEVEGALTGGTVLHFTMSGVGWAMGTWAVTGCSIATPPVSGECF